MLGVRRVGHFVISPRMNTCEIWQRAIGCLRPSPKMSELQGSGTACKFARNAASAAGRMHAQLRIRISEDDFRGASGTQFPKSIKQKIATTNHSWISAYQILYERLCQRIMTRRIQIPTQRRKFCEMRGFHGPLLPVRAGISSNGQDVTEAIEGQAMS